MWDFFTDNLISSMALIVMFYSIALQISYLKFRRKSIEGEGKIVEVIKKNFWQIAKVEFNAANEQKIGQSLCFFNKKLPGAEVEIYYNPRDFEPKKKSIFIVPILKKLGFKPNEQTKLIILMKQQNPSLYHLSLIFLGLILLTFS